MRPLFLSSFLLILLIPEFPLRAQSQEQSWDNAVFSRSVNQRAPQSDSAAVRGSFSTALHAIASPAADRLGWGPMIPTEGGEVPSPKSGFLAALYSLILPGMGEWYAGDFSKGKYPLITEGVLWAGYIGLNWYGTWTRDDGRLFAAEHAGAMPAGKPDDYFTNIGNYADTYDYNQKRLVNRELDKVYSTNPADGYLWKWDSDASRQRFKETRILSDNLYNDSRFIILAMIANRIWSAVQAGLIVGDYNRSLRSGQTHLPLFHADVRYLDGRVDGIALRFGTQF